MVHVMSEVKKYNAYAEGLTVHFELDSEGAWIAAEDFEAQRLRADTAEAGVQASVEVINSLHDQIAVLTELLHRSKVDAELWFSEFGEPSDGKYSAAFTEIDTALNPNPEAESHE